MHGLETIVALNERASRRCERCKKPHCSYPGAERFVKKCVIVKFSLPVRDLADPAYAVADRPKPGEVLLCGPCKGVLVELGAEVRDAE